MKKVFEKGNDKMVFTVYDLYYYRVYCAIGEQEFYDGHFNTLEEVIDYINFWLKEEN